MSIPTATPLSNHSATQKSIDHGPASHREAAPREAVRASTIRVPTRALLGRGVEKIRVLSETRFLAMIRQLVEDSVRRRAAEGVQDAAKTDHGTAGESAAAPARAELQESWTRLRATHSGQLDSIESRLASLTNVFESIQGAITKLDERTSAPRRDNQTSRPASPPASPTAAAPAIPITFSRQRPPPRDLRRELQRGAIAGPAGHETPQPEGVDESLDRPEA